MRAGVAVRAVAFQHLPDDTELHRVVVDGRYPQVRGQGGGGRHLLPRYRLIGRLQRQAYRKAAAASRLALHPDAPAQQLYQAPRDRQSQAEALRVDMLGRTLERLEHPLDVRLRHADARIAYHHPQPAFPVAHGELHPARRGELHGIREQVVRNLLDAVGVALDGHPRPLGPRIEQQPLVVGKVAVFTGDPLQQAVQAERHKVRRILALVQAVHVQQVVYQAQDMAARVPYVLQVAVTLALVTDARSQFRAAVDGVQRAPYVMRQGQHDLLALCQQVTAVPARSFQPEPVAVLAFDVAVDKDIEQHHADDARPREVEHDAQRPSAQPRHGFLTLRRAPHRLILQVVHHPVDVTVQGVVAYPQRVRDAGDVRPPAFEQGRFPLRASRFRADQPPYLPDQLFPLAFLLLQQELYRIYPCPLHRVGVNAPQLVQADCHPFPLLPVNRQVPAVPEQGAFTVQEEGRQAFKGRVREPSLFQHRPFLPLCPPEHALLVPCGGDDAAHQQDQQQVAGKYLHLQRAVFIILFHCFLCFYRLFFSRQDTQ
ncbi:hypothetical protein M139_4660 [Bacteroides fragilis str. S23L24]|nr:hypothetical protein M139_4660 [Bacteroides fragilis str. S23L24]